ncbi:uncharacterized protein PHACADRAFT_165575 [Phanerochaete carnosa HHB-10118-sp]|uniref:Uncharacterized protein n=1 Tax=Phanerochaete carnosa (strain HHB-10118-sp) TaxID=650164 RepID=K5VWG9_PHACS|nr:uncharacterized protein PHACADRAFT_165575 [Phanerochaete carnosa HHB-10118-sp]EKM50934.1 hypothetical protein PHACADRAFT_165575 [Phanerochaete carnosa HHB-10118-sp]
MVASGIASHCGELQAYRLFGKAADHVISLMSLAVGLALLRGDDRHELSPNDILPHASSKHIAARMPVLSQADLEEPELGVCDQSTRPVPPRGPRLSRI